MRKRTEQSWTQLAISQAAAAAQLCGPDVVRPSISRAYYAIYSHATARLMHAGVTRFGRFAYPSHADLPNLVRGSLPGVPAAKRREASLLTRRLRAMREIADYRPTLALSESDRIDAVRAMILARGLLGGAP